MPMTIPGLVHIWPVPRVTESMRPWAMVSARASSAAGKKEDGVDATHLCEDGDGDGSLAARLTRRRPTRREPVKATAWMSGCWTRAALTVLEASSMSSEKTPSGRPACATAC
jgi:hypothetical protein